MSLFVSLAVCLLTRLLLVQAKTANRKSDKYRQETSPQHLDTGNSGWSFNGGGSSAPISSEDGESCEHRDLYIWLVLLSVGTTLVVVGAVVLCKVMRDLKCRQDALKQKITYMEMETILHLPEFQETWAMGSNSGSFEFTYSYDKVLNARYLQKDAGGKSELCHLPHVPIWLSVCTIFLILLLLALSLITYYTSRLVMHHSQLKQKVKYMEMETILQLPKSGDEDC